MFRTHLHSGVLEVEGQRYTVHYFEQRTARGAQRYSCEVVLDGSDRIIVDDDSMVGLQARVARVVPATVYSRALAGHPPEAA